VDLQQQIKSEQPSGPSYTRQDEELLLQELKNVSNLQLRVVAELERLCQVEEQKQREDETKYWQDFNMFSKQIQTIRYDEYAWKSNLEGLVSELDRLRCNTNLNSITNKVYSDAFQISVVQGIGAINNLRLGKLPYVLVEWDEINAAWGQATSLLHTIVKRINFKFSSWKLVPMGSFSRMQRLQDQSQYELYGSSDISLGRLFWYRRFDTAMVGFLFCVKELADACEQKNKAFRLPYRIDKDKIGDMSIKIQFNNEETWTKSLKYLLTNLKCLLYETLVM